MSTVHVVVPCGIDDPNRPSGGNAYDRRMCRELAALGWTVVEHAVPGDWTTPDRASAGALAAVLAGLPDGAVTLLDGLLAPWVSDAGALAGRLALVVLVHMVPRARDGGGASIGAPARPFGGVPGAVLAAATAVVATSPWAKSCLVEGAGVPGVRVHVVEPGVDEAPAGRGTAGGGRLLCVAAVTPIKGHDILLDALAAVGDVDWACTCAGALDLDPAFTEGLLRDARSRGIADRVHFTGPHTRAGIDALYASADVLVLTSREESYGMVVTEALSRGIPVIATNVGGVSRTLGHAPSGDVPGMLVPPEDPDALAGALRAWLDDARLRARLRGAALERRAALRTHGWEAAAAGLAAVLDGAARTCAPRAGAAQAGAPRVGAHPAGEASAGAHPAGEASAGETPAGETPAGETPAGETPAGAAAVAGRS